LRHIASFNLPKGTEQVRREKRQALSLVTAEVRGRDIGSLVERGQANGSDRG